MENQEEIKEGYMRVVGESPVSPLYKKLFIGLMFLFVLIAVTGGAYFMGRTQSTPVVTPSPTLQPTQTVISPSVSPSSEVKISPTIKVVKDESIVPVGQNTVNFARIGDKTYLRYRGKIYDDSDQIDPKKVSISNPDQNTWYGLTDAPPDTSFGSLLSDEVFGFKVAPDTKSFSFIMRWGKENSPISYYVYYYSAFDKYQQSLLVNKFTPDFNLNKSQDVPKIDQFSPDGKYLSLQMYVCWNCGGSKPETLLVRLQDYEMKRIGKTSYFFWKNNGEYEYKEYKIIACPPTPTGEWMGGECTEKPENLPLKTGQF
ncbi:hypothetical protein A2866_01120 [Candidatus Roizmanbacteria bacterium RIFCSPHIGHO2_01_FULL_39_8]|uniref:Uncharacterized protein n=3 Tax=Candidatus Roizmaniibacteriota TaxID=1752723 RepID=A0A1F7GM89_9BACT|nr:MAG: hypothetical protein A2866_01120 [Candidatus Roizmanbacteria bacterium RIFCSPHIGHO2_01_FULL_39_8]OGK25536.1 MAG: hypothetical protein A3C28_01610 [Candidatus Roizmanbacteria bacterium RIFCSPHIGHO2_02_FULL_39_9]OGK35068.1 MAG: hypothetical protein A3F60_03210 [Candidatus Roizmanbacteria bacterium RIFCSPHIGHO2_12_FULL_39_8]